MVQDLKSRRCRRRRLIRSCREIRKLILSGSLQPGEPFPSELSLCRKLGVNRSTVREGIRQLEADGLVRRSGRRRLFVSIPDTSQIAPRATDTMVLSRLRSSNSGRCVVRSNRFRRDWRQSTGQKINWFRCGQT
ncbi:winged helix-turn-helix domain-containing protein [Maritimibacter sp.]|uniref:winged helix-turn-helix domain-containing protein n=1 Tax=Maritimibacter sp. TaxID=2003363 RepID=UPI00338DD216